MNDRLKLAIAAGLIATFGLTACQKAEQDDNSQAAVAEAVAEPEVGGTRDTGRGRTRQRYRHDWF